MKKLELNFQQLLAGTQTELPPTLTMHVDGEQLTQAQIVARLQGFLAVYEQVSATKAAYGQALLAQEAMAVQAQAFKVSYGQVLHHVLGKASPMLASFGINVVERKAPTAETQVLAHAKRLATRKARGTLGKRQKKLIKGAEVAAVTVSAPDAPSALPARNASGAG
jgi:hypothetical protein